MLRRSRIIYFTMEQQPLVGQSLLIIEDSWSHSDTPHSVGLLWTSDQPDAEICTWQHITLTTYRHLCLWWDSNPQSTIPASERPQFHALDRAATGIGQVKWLSSLITQLTLKTTWIEWKLRKSSCRNFDREGLIFCIFDSHGIPQVAAKRRAKQVGNGESIKDANNKGRQLHIFRKVLGLRNEA